MDSQKKNGIIREDGKLIYYVDDVPTHAGVIKIDDDIYYAGSGGEVATGKHAVHRSMAHGILDRGIYTFGEDGKLIKGSYVSPRKGRRKKNFNKKKAAIVFVSALAAIIVLFLMSSGVAYLIHRMKADETVTGSVDTVSIPTFSKEVVLCSDDAQKLYNGLIGSEAGLDGDDLYMPLDFEYFISKGEAILYLSENKDLSFAKEYELDISQRHLYIHNLKTGTTYYYKVTVDDEEYNGSFKTADGIRFIKLPGVYNTRDVGGYTTLDGKKVKQGMIIRGTELDDLTESSYFLTDEGVEMAKDFSFVFELDLRESSKGYNNYVSRLGADVRHQFFNCPAYQGIFEEGNREYLREIFKALANEENYPMYIHCTHGADRTGGIVYLIGGILNMDERDMINDYTLSELPVSKIDALKHRFQSYEGDTVQEQIVSFLINDVGVTEEEINSIRNILLEN